MQKLLFVVKSIIPRTASWNIILKSRFWEHINSKKIELINDSFELHLDILDPFLLQFSINHYHVDFYVMPNDTLVFSADADNVFNTLKYQCKNRGDQLYTLGLSAIESEKYRALKPYFIKGTGWANYPHGLFDGFLKFNRG